VALESRHAWLVIREAVGAVAVLVVGKETAPRFGAEEAGANQAFEQWAGTETGLAAFGVEVL
jgi:hypothetical protein